MTSVEPQMLKGVLALLLLRLVAEREDYGYSLVQRLRAAGLAEAAEGSVYPALARLEARGLLVPRLVREGRGPGRRYYSPSASGAAEVDRLQASWDEVARAVAAVGPPAAHAVGADRGPEHVHEGPGTVPVPDGGGRV